MKRKGFLQMLGFGAASIIAPGVFISKDNTKFIDSECLKESSREKTLIQKIREDESFRLAATCITYHNRFIHAAEQAEQWNKANIDKFLYDEICHCSAENEPHYHNKLS